MRYTRIAVLSMAMLSLAAISYAAQGQIKMGCCGGDKACPATTPMASATTQPTTNDGKYACPVGGTNPDNTVNCPKCGMNIKPADSPAK